MSYRGGYGGGESRGRDYDSGSRGRDHDRNDRSGGDRDRSVRNDRIYIVIYFIFD